MTLLESNNLLFAPIRAGELPDFSELPSPKVSDTVTESNATLSVH